jgi:hypothetical protein
MTEGYDGTQANGATSDLDMSADGRYVAFVSTATNLVAGLNLEPGTYMYWLDTQLCTIAFVARIVNGIHTGGYGYLLNYPAISNDGRYVGFTSPADLVPADANGLPDAYIRDMQTGANILISRNDAGSVGNMPSQLTDLTADGRFGLFYSGATNLDPVDASPDVDAFIFDRQTNQVRSVTIQTGGTPAAATIQDAVVSDDGRFVAYESLDSTLVPNDTNGVSDIFLTDLQALTTTLVSFTLPDFPWHVVLDRKFTPQISSDGRYVAYETQQHGITLNDGNGFSDIFVYDRLTGENTKVSNSPSEGRVNDAVHLPSLSSNGRYLTFSTSASNLVEGEAYWYNLTPDIFLVDLLAGTTIRVSQTLSGGLVTGEFDTWRYSDVSDDGRFVVYASRGTNIIEPDTNNQPDLFLADLQGRYPHSRPIVSFPTIGRTDVTWIQFAPTPTLFEVQRSNDALNWTVLGTTTPGQTTFSDTTVAFGIHFVAYRLRALTPDPNYTLYSVLGYVDTVIPITASVVGVGQINVDWAVTTHAPYQYVVQREQNDLDVFVNLATLTDGQTTYVDLTASCDNDYSYRLEVQTADGTSLGYSRQSLNVRFPCVADTVALFRPEYNWMIVMQSLLLHPPQSDYQVFLPNPPDMGEYIMGDWDGDGDDTPGVYAASGAFWYTNELGNATTWSSIWVGLTAHSVVAGRFSAAYRNDCFGVVDQSATPHPRHGYGYALYYACDLAHGPTPPLTSIWLGAPLPDDLGLNGDYQFSAGEFNYDGLDTLAARRETRIAWTNTFASNGTATFSDQSFIGTPSTLDYGIFVVGNWDSDHSSEYGLIYQNGWLYYKLDMNSGAYYLHRIGLPFGTPFTATAWSSSN